MLSALFDMPPADIGYSIDVQSEHDHSRPDDASHLGLVALLEVVDGRTEAVERLQSTMLELRRQELLNRRQVLKVMGTVPAAAGLHALGSRTVVGDRRPTLDGRQTVDELAAIARQLERAYHTCDPERLLLPTRAMIANIEELMPGTRDPDLRRATLSLLARAGLLAGRLSFFDIHRSLDARAYLDLAREASQEAGDQPLTSVVFGHIAFLPAAKHNFQASASYLSAARDALSRQPAPTIGPG
jgi:hypothetical protein